MQIKLKKKNKHQEVDNKNIETHNQIYTLSIFGFVTLKKTLQEGRCY